MIFFCLHPTSKTKGQIRDKDWIIRAFYIIQYGLRALVALMALVALVAAVSICSAFGASHIEKSFCSRFLYSGHAAVKTSRCWRCK